MDLVSIIVPTYKRSQSLLETLESILLQDYPKIEIIIVDDNGVENSLDQKETQNLVELLQAENNNIVYIQLENNSGAAIARNIGIEKANGRYISFLDDDDSYAPNKISTQVTHLKQYKDSKTAFVKCEMSYVDGGRITRTTDKSKYFSGDLLKNHILDSHAIVGTPTFLFKKEALLGVGGFFNTPIKQEYMLVLRLLSNGYVGAHEPSSLVFINTNLDGVSVSKSEVKKDAILDIYNKRKSLASSFTYSEKMLLDRNHNFEMYRWYSMTNLNKSYAYLLKYVGRGYHFKFEFYKFFLVLLSKFFLRDKFYMIKILFRKVICIKK